VEVAFAPASAKALFSPLRRVYLFHGEDDPLKDEAIALLRAATVDEAFSDFDYEVVEADRTPVEDILSSAGLAPFGSPARLLVVRGAELYRRRERQADADRLAQSVATLPPATCLALRVAASEDERSRSKTILSSKLDAAIKQHGAVVQCKALTDEALIRWLHTEAGNAGKQLTDEAAARLTQAAKGERIALAHELEKAICYVGDSSTITIEDVEATCSYDAEDVMFKLVDATSLRNADLALRLFHELLRYNPKPQAVAGRLLALLSRQYRLLIQAHGLAHLRVDPGSLKSLPPEVAADLPGEGSIVGMAWKARQLYGQARGWNDASLVGAMELLLECDLANKGGGEGSENVVTNLEMLIVKLCQAK
jgi:DNA polymerase III subunit delta